MFIRWCCYFGKRASPSSCTCKFLSEAPLNSLWYSMKARISRCSLQSNTVIFSKIFLEDFQKLSWYKIANQFFRNWQTRSEFNLIKEMFVLLSFLFFLYVYIYMYNCVSAITVTFYHINRSIIFISELVKS